jgi:Pregnancy-associated plasma protein-A/GEVED domain
MKILNPLKYCFYFLLLLNCTNLIAQFPCGTDLVMKTRPLLQKQLQQIEQNYQRNRKSIYALDEIPDNTTIYTIPVVFHIYHLGEAIGTGSNVSLASIQDALLGLNNAFRAQSSYFGVSPDVKIQFVLASRSPNCGATDGVVRIDGRSVAGYETNGLAYPDENAETAFRALSSWPNSEYVNIRVFHQITGTGGYAYFLNDLFMPANSLNQASSSFWAHEMGHSFNLYHTFEGDYDNMGNPICPINTDPENDGDQISDTDPHKRDVACNYAAINECTGVAYGNVLKNIMSYSCEQLFTTKQVERMRYALLNYRKSLIYSLGKVAPDGSDIPVSACIPTAPNGLSPYFGISNFSLSNIVYSGTSPFYTGVNYENLVCLSQTNLQAGIASSFQLTGTYGNSAFAKIYIDYNNDGDFNDQFEQVYNTNNWMPTHSGTIIPPAGVTLNTNLRMRVMMDGTIMTACNLPGNISDGSGLAVDFAVKITSQICTQMFSVKNGTWNDPTTWSCDRIPLSTDNVTISSGNIVTVPSGVFQVKNVTVSGTILYLPGSELKLN